MTIATLIIPDKLFIPTKRLDLISRPPETIQVHTYVYASRRNIRIVKGIYPLKVFFLVFDVLNGNL